MSGPRNAIGAILILYVFGTIIGETFQTNGRKEISNGREARAKKSEETDTCQRIDSNPACRWAMSEIGA